LDRIREISVKLPDRDIAELCDLIPWDNIKAAMQEGITWDGFLRDTGWQISSGLNLTDLKKLHDWVGSPEAGKILQLPDMKFIGLLLESAFLPLE
jgi:hypothetical protein